MHPTTLLFLVLPFGTAFKASILSMVFLAGTGMWLLLRDLGAGRAAALLGASLFAFSGYVVSLANVINLLDSAAFMPLTLFLSARAMTRGFAPWGSLAALSLAVQIMAGEPALLLCTAVALLALHPAARAAAPGAPPGLVASGARLAGLTLLGAALAMAAVLPSTELLARSERGAGFEMTDALKWSQPPLSLLEIVLPGFFGDPTTNDLSTFWGGSTFDFALPFILSIHVGAGALILAGFGIGRWSRGDRSERAGVAALAGCALLGVALALGRFLPLYPALLAILPPLRLVKYPSKFFLLFTWAVAVLAARGYDQAVLPGRGDGRRRLGAAAGIIVAGVAVYAAGSWLGLFGLLADRGLGLPADLVDTGTREAIVTGMSLSAAMMALQMVLVALALTARAERLRRAALLVVPLAGALHAAAPVNPVAPASFYTDAPAVAGILGPPGPGGRVWAMPRPKGFGYLTPPVDDGDSLRWGFYWDRMTLRNMTYLPHRYAFAYDRGTERLDVMPQSALAKAMQSDSPPMPPETIARLLSVAAVDRVITYGGLDAPGLHEAGRLEGRSNIPVVVMRNANVLARARLVGRVEVHPDLLRATARLREASFDPATTVILEEALPGAPAGTAGPVDGEARILEESAARILLETSASSGAWLVLADTFYPGWVAEVDGAETPIVRANTMFRAVPLPAGRHSVEMTYRPSSVRSGLMVSAASLLLAALLAVPRRR